MKPSFSAVIIRLIPLLFLFCSFLPLFAAGPPVAQQDGEGQRYVTIDFNDVDINLFIKYISEWTQKNFIVDREVKGKVTVISPTRISEADAYRVFESVLEVHGFTAIPSGSVTKIVPTVEARSKNIATMRGRSATSVEDKVVTQIIALKHANAEELKIMLTPLVSKTSVLIAQASANKLIITDFQSNIARLMDIITAIDVPSGGEELVVIPLRRASAEIVSKALSQVFVTTAATAQKGIRPEIIKIIPFDRTNVLIVFAPKTAVQRVRDLVAQMDEDVPRGEGNMRVLFLQHANAEELVKVLLNLPGDRTSSRTSSSTYSSNPSTMSSSASSSSPSSSSLANASNSASLSSPSSSGPSGGAISKDLIIVADTATNALIITGPREEFQEVEAVIKKLDIPRRMVYLEALIMEVRADKTFNIGVQWATAGDNLVGGFSGSEAPGGKFANLESINAGALPSTGFSLGVLKQGVQIGGVNFPNLGAVVNAFKTDSDINVIATPQILTTDNKKATIKVGENVPFLVSTNTTSALTNPTPGTGTLFQNFEYKDVATSLTITPQVNQSDVIRMEIGVEVIKLADTTASSTPTTFTRTANTTVVVHNQETVVIGGMIGNDTTTSESKVPLLGDIPLLGWLFKSHSSTGSKTNLYIFITPHIVENPAELADVYYKKREAMEKEQKQPDGITDKFFNPTENPAHSAALADIGFAKMQQNDLGRAREYFNQALKIDANNGSALLNLGVICEREGKKTEAESWYRKVLALVPVKEEKRGQGPATADPLKDMAKENIKRLGLGKKTEK